MIPQVPDSTPTPCWFKNNQPLPLKDSNTLEKMYFIFLKENKTVQLMEGNTVNFNQMKMNGDTIARGTWFFDGDEGISPYNATQCAELEDRFRSGHFDRGDSYDATPKPRRYVMKLPDGNFRQFRATKKGDPKGREVKRGWKGTTTLLYPNYPTNPHFQVFGVPLPILMNHPLNVGSSIPLVVLRCIQYLERPDVLKTDGIFRESASVADVDLLKHQWDTGHDVPFEGNYFCHEATNLLKLYVRELPEPLCNRELLPAWNNVFNSSSPEQQLKDTIAKLPATNRSILGSIVGMLKKVSDCSGQNRMDVKNLAIVWVPNIFGDGVSLEVGSKLISELISHPQQYF